MPHFYFNLFNGLGDASDEEGRDLADLAEARQAAIEGIRSILCEELLLGVIDLRGRMEITDAHGNTVMTIDFSEAVDLRGAPR